jgi:hypothetical protein
MSLNALQEKKEKVLKRLGNTINCTNKLLSDINDKVCEMIEDNEELLRLSRAYKTWVRKVNANR